jgi:hypothetical protein
MPRKTKRKIFSSLFIGKQLSRLKMGQSYYGIIISTISAIALLKIAFDINILIIILLFPILLSGAFLIGLYLDKKDINSMDFLKSVEMQQRFLNTGQVKLQEFELLRTEMVLEGLKAIQEGKTINIDQIREKYNEYKNKWSYK